MKLRKLIWIGVLFLPLLSCNDPDTTVETEALLQLSIPLISTGMDNAENYSFSGNTTFCLATKDKVQNCPNNILHVTPGNGSKLILSELNGDINSLQLMWGYQEIGSDNFNMQSSIELSLAGKTPNMQDFSIDLDEILSPIISKIDSNPKSYIKVMIMGNANAGIYSMAKMEIPIIVEHEVFEVRFTL